jgi:general secretion pathway protein K
MKPGPMRHHQRGMALVIVLWLVVLLSVMAAGHARNVHTDSLLSARQIGLAEARALADAGVRKAILRLLGNGPVPPVDGTRFQVRLAGDTVSVGVRDSRGLVDLNAAGPDLLSVVMGLAGADGEEQQKLVGAIMDWRDKDQLTRLHGAEDGDYRAAGLGWTARDDSFGAVEELRFVIGMKPEIYASTAQYFTVYSGRSTLDPDFAPVGLVDAVGAATGSAAKINTGRAGPTAQQVTGPLRGTYHVYSTATGRSGATASIEAVVRISGRRSNPYLVLEWRETSREPGPETEVRTG